MTEDMPISEENYRKIAMRIAREMTKEECESLLIPKLIEQLMNNNELYYKYYSRYNLNDKEDLIVDDDEDLNPLKSEEEKDEKPGFIEEAEFLDDFEEDED